MPASSAMSVLHPNTTNNADVGEVVHDKSKDHTKFLFLSLAYTARAIHRQAFDCSCNRHAFSGNAPQMHGARDES